MNKVGLLALAGLLCSLLGCSRQEEPLAAATEQPSPTYPPLSTRVAPTPTAVPTAILARGCAQERARVGHYVVVGYGCGQTLTITALSSGRISARRIFSAETLDFIGAITNTIVLVDSSCGTPMRDCKRLLGLPHLRMVGDRFIDTNVLGVLDGKIYLDDWCCNGRPNGYQPATIFTLSPETAKQSSAFDLYPDEDFHDPQQQLLGQGENNYMIGKYLYVVVDRENIPFPIVYRYDLRNPNKGFIRLRKPAIAR